MIIDNRTPRRRSGSRSAAARLQALQLEAGALTHDFNNLLTVVIGANERLVAELDKNSEQHDLALVGLHAAEQGAALLRRLLDLAQDRTPLDACDCTDALEDLGRMARLSMPAGVTLKVSGPGTRVLCAADRAGLEGALLNLCLNAGQARPDDGLVWLKAREVSGANDAHRLGLSPGRYVAFTIRDCGAGLSPETLARAMEPLFTTKPRGTGLGLSSVKAFADAAGGGLALQSREGYGATATLYVPVASAPGTERAHAASRVRQQS